MFPSRFTFKKSHSKPASEPSTSASRACPHCSKNSPQTTFIGHADFFWANVSSEVDVTTSYPTGPVKRGGLTDKMLGDYENLWADLAAYSGRNMLARDEEFSRDFLKRTRTS